MKKYLFQLFTIAVLVTHNCLGLAAVNPITVTYSNGSASFSADSSGSVNYVVSVNSGVIPPNVPLTFHLTSAGSSSGLLATQQLTGSSNCTNVSALCGSTFSLSAGQSCCLSFSLTSSKAGNYSLQPSISTTPAAYPAQAASALKVVVSGVAPATTYTGIYALTENCRVSYSIDNATTWNSMLNQQCGNRDSLAVSSSGAMYMATSAPPGVGGVVVTKGTVIYTQDGSTWVPMTVVFPSVDTNDFAASVYSFNDILYVGTNNGYVLYTPDNGVTWSTAATPSQLGGAPGAISSLYVSTNSTLYVGTQNSNEVYASSNNGSSWTVQGSSPDGSSIVGLAVTTNGTIYVVTGNIQDGSGTPAPLYFDGTNWVYMTPLPSGAIPNSIATLGDTIYVGSDHGNILYTTSNMASWISIGASPDNVNITSLLINQSTLSPLFVETTGVIPVNGSAGTVTVTNLSNTTVTNVHAQLSSALSGVTQTPSIACASLAPQSSCTLSFTSTSPYIPQTLDVVGNGATGAIYRVALVSSMNGYLVYNVDSFNAYIVDHYDVSGSPQVWSQSPNNIPGITEADTVSGSTSCNGATDGQCDSSLIVSYYDTNSIPHTNYAAGLCYQSTVGSVSQGTWYLPSTCELGAGLYFNSISNAYVSCAPAASTGIFSLYGLGVVNNLTTSSGHHWSSTEYAAYPKDSAWAQSFALGGGGSTFSRNKSKVVGGHFGVRCSQALPL